MPLIDPLSAEVLVDPGVPSVIGKAHGSGRAALAGFQSPSHHHCGQPRGPFRGAGRDYNISQAWVSRLVASYRAEGEAAFELRSRRARTPSKAPI